MKNLARLTLFFTLSFAILFSAAILIELLSSWINMVRFIPAGAAPGKDAAKLAWKALPAALYLSVLLSVSYSARRNLSIPRSILFVFILGCVLTAGAALGIRRAEALGPAVNPVSPIEGAPGLILSRHDYATVLLRDSSDARGSRVVSIPGRPLIYQEVPLGPNNTILNVPPLPFGVELPWFARSLDIDLSLGAGELEKRFHESFRSFAAYAFSLILLLSSLRFLLELSQWPLANLFLGALVFRLVLTLETFLNAGEINGLITSFLNNRVRPGMVTPLVFGALSVLFILYTLIVHLARLKTPETGRDRDD